MDNNLRKVFGNKVLRTTVFQHLCDIHKRWISLSSLKQQQQQQHDQEREQSWMIKSTIKGDKLLAEGSLARFLKFNATEWFIKAFDSFTPKCHQLTSRLLFKSFKYNNIRAFNHILDNTNTDLDDDITPSQLTNILKHGNVQMFERYISMHSARSFQINSINHLMFAINSGNVNFVRLLLQHKCYHNDPDMYFEEDVDPQEFKRSGINVDMLTMLHKEYGLLYLHDLWALALKQSTHLNVTDSVRYIIEHLPSDLTILCSAHIGLLVEFIAKPSHFAIFKVFFRVQQFAKTIITNNLLVHMAADNGHDELFKFLDDNGPLPTSLMKYVDRVNGFKVKITPLAAIRTGDLDLTEAMIAQVDHIDLYTWTHMSTSMATLLSNRRHNPPKLFNLHSLCEMIECFGLQPDHPITERMVLNFIDNCDPAEEMGNISRAFDLAARHSVKILQHIIVTFKIHNINEQMFMSVIQNDNYDVLSHIIQSTPKDQLEELSQIYDVDTAINELISRAPLSVVSMMLDNLSSIRENNTTCLWALVNPSLEVFQHVIKLFPIDQIMELTGDIMSHASDKDKPEVLRIMAQLLKDNGRTIPLPTLDWLETLALLNRYNVLEYYFGTSQFNSLPKIHRLRTLNSMIYHSLLNGNIRILNHCSSLIQDIQNNKKRSHDESYLGDNFGNVAMPNHATPRLETAAHSVFIDRKLMTMIMNHIVDIHQNHIGVDKDKRIKGGHLLANNSLERFIVYGASEWFHRALPSLDRSTPNGELLGLALLHPNTSILNTLLADPMMVFQASVNMVEEMLQMIRHPSMIRKLLQLGFKFSTDEDDDNSDVPLMINGWLNKPWALEMFQLLHKKSILSEDELLSLFNESIKLNNTPVIQYYLDTCFGLVVERLNDGDHDDSSHVISELIESCLHSGCNSSTLNMVLPHIPLQFLTVLDGDDLAKSASKRGNVDILNLLVDQYTSKWWTLMQALPTALEYNENMDLINHILNANITDAHIYEVNSINPSILSMDLIQRLMANDSIDCDFGKVLGDSIKIGNNEIIDFITRNEKGLFKTDYQHVFIAALSIGDINTARMAISSPHFQKAEKATRHQFIQYLGSDKQFILINDDFELFVKVLFERLSKTDELSSLLLSVGSSTSRVKIIIDHCSRNKLFARDGNIESLDLIIQFVISAGCETQDAVPSGISNARVITHFLDKGYIKLEEDNSNGYLARMVDWACKKGHVDVIKAIHQRCTTPLQLFNHMPSTNILINKAACFNHHQVLSYLFEDDIEHGVCSPFKRASKHNKMNIANSLTLIGLAAKQIGNFKIVDMCNRLRLANSSN
ncbi:hypothetical protein SAMD00019534_100370 [Acytostelium subglobosum LB1]|uniref:hypothetical protein n=1 Tax=Acytostelium subglobosum LB1 TaxID=1410327 RepID=UPI0006451CDF|nr:hypothetical protein SAMD00019534_100370 [Acytostelium subglobosum LB1]GAM26862.1 hypothetical protein SAMD00019534_100370 [Acytostelium subglobosum LB1]|eukprot:XP_012750130.1 hypothetical protein SAMD00019534_100370 [Acytostelium subglobosum LB1]